MSLTTAEETLADMGRVMRQAGGNRTGEIRVEQEEAELTEAGEGRVLTGLTGLAGLLGRIRSGPGGSRRVLKRKYDKLFGPLFRV
jgi:hypothetical protein